MKPPTLPAAVPLDAVADARVRAEVERRVAAHERERRIAALLERLEAEGKLVPAMRVAVDATGAEFDPARRLCEADPTAFESVFSQAGALAPVRRVVPAVGLDDSAGAAGGRVDFADLANEETARRVDAAARSRVKRTGEDYWSVIKEMTAPKGGR